MPTKKAATALQLPEPEYHEGDRLVHDRRNVIVTGRQLAGVVGGEIVWRYSVVRLAEDSIGKPVPPQTFDGAGWAAVSELQTPAEAARRLEAEAVA